MDNSPQLIVAQVQTPLPLPMPVPTSPTQTAFISGPIEPPQGYFQTHYEPALLKAISAGHSFVLGPAPGMDTQALRFLITQGVPPSHITVYLAEFEEELKKDDIDWFVKLGGGIKVEGETTGQRDAAMTRDSDYDILRYMTVEEQKAYYGDSYYLRVSATEKNERRRKGLPLHALNAAPLVDGHAERTGRRKMGLPGSGFKKVLNGIFGSRS